MFPVVVVVGGGGVVVGGGGGVCAMREDSNSFTYHAESTL